MKQINSWKWGLVTFCGCITCAVIGKYEHPSLSVIIALLVAAFGAIAVAQEQKE